MLAHSIRPILNLVPEALSMIKQASVDQEYPIHNKDSCLASALQLKYFEKVAHQTVDYDQIERVYSAVKVYGLQDQLNDLTDKMVKAASLQIMIDALNPITEYQIKEAAFRDSQRNPGNADALCAEAEILYKEAQSINVEPSDEVKLYSGHGYFDKVAALKSLTVRYDQTKDPVFIKVARMIVDAEKDPRMAEPATLTKIASFVANEDYKRHLEFKGFNFFKEAFHTKEAAYNRNVMVKLAGSSVPFTKIAAVGSDNISHYLGSDIADEYNRGADNFKQVAETLPLDMQHVLLNLTKNV